MARLIAILMVSILWGVSIAQDSEFTYLSPSEVKELPKEVASKLNSEKCLIPKWFHEFGGVTEGEFSKKGQNDIAVLCKYGDSYSIRIFWGGPSKCKSKINSLGQFISTVDEKYILDRYSWYGGNKPPEITHHGINDHYLEKSSFVKYCHKGQWLELTGAD